MLDCLPARIRSAAVGASRAAPHAIAAANLDTYEAATRLIVDLNRIVARNTTMEPIAFVAERLAELTRDAAAIQLSTIRWMLDL